MKLWLKSTLLAVGLMFGGAIYVSAAGCNPFVVATGGTGVCAFQANTVLIGNGTGKIATTTAGTNGFVLALVSGVPTWVATSSINNGVSSIAGTANQVTLSDSTGAVTVSLAGPHNFTTLTGCLTGNGTNPITGSGTCATFAYLFNTLTTFGTTTAATTTPLWAQGGIFASTTSTLPALAVSQSGSGPVALFEGGNIGIGTTSPFAALSLDRNTKLSSSTIVINEYNYGTATSTSELIDCRSASQTHIRIGVAAQTLQLNSTSLIPGQKCIVVVENPNNVAGAITWSVSAGAILLWAGGTVPTQTTTANKQDVWSFLATTGSTTKTILGAISSNF